VRIVTGPKNASSTPSIVLSLTHDFREAPDARLAVGIGVVDVAQRLAIRVGLDRAVAHLAARRSATLGGNVPA
jgi:hypothetical protein